MRKYILTFLDHTDTGEPIRLRVPKDTMAEALSVVEHERWLSIAYGEPMPTFTIKSITV